MRITQKEVRELFDYHESGVLIRRKDGGGTAKKNNIAGCINAIGYRVINIKNKLYLAHRLIWLWHNGYMPELCIDHINQIRDDNRIENLRESSWSCNLRNTGNQKDTTSGVKGVSLDKRRNTWNAYITIHRKRINIGQSKNFCEAVCLRLAAEQCVDWHGSYSTSPAYVYIKNVLQVGQRI